MATKQTNGRSLSLILAAGLGMTLQAADIAFIGEDGSGSGDLSNPNHWAGGELPGATASVAFTSAGVVTSTSPMALGQVTINANPIVFRQTGALTVNGDWLMTQARLGCQVTTGSVITATGRMKLAWTVDVCGSRLDVVGEGAKLEMKSGTQSLFGAQDGCCDNTLHVADGGSLVFTSLWCAPSSAVAKQTNSTIVVETDGSFAANNIAFAAGKDASSLCGRHHVKVLSGGSMALNSDLTLGAAFAPGSEATVDGFGSRLRVGTFAIGSASDGNTLTVSNGALFTQPVVTGTSSVGTGAAASNNVLKVASGAGFDALGNLVLGDSGSHNRIHVDSAASFCVSNYIAESGVSKCLNIGVAAGAHDNELSVSNTPMTSIRSLTVGVSGSANRAVFREATGLPFTSAMVGKNAGADGNELVVHGVGTWNVAALPAAFGGGSGNLIRYEGFAFGGSGLGNPNLSVSRGNRLEFGTGLTAKTWGALMVNGSENGHIRLDGGTWTHRVGSGNNARTYVGPNVRLLLDNGALMDCTNGWAFTVGNSTDTCAISGDVLEVRNGAELCVSDLRVSHSVNLFDISNATVLVDTALNFPEVRSIYQPSYGTHGFCTNNTIRLAGMTPRFVTKGVAMSFGYALDPDDGLLHVGDNRLEFQIPTEGYQQPPLEALASDAGAAVNVQLSRSTRIFADVTAFTPQTRTSVPLIRASGTIVIDDADELAAGLPEGCRLKLSDDKKLLSLSVPGCGGLIMLVR